MDDDFFEGDPTVEDESKVRLAQIVRTVKSRFTYTYDFGDSWRHDLTLEKILPLEPGASYPRCVDGQRNGPPEDCGGPPGYADLLKVIANPKHREHKAMLEWSGRYDPEDFSLEAVNYALTGKRAVRGRK